MPNDKPISNNNRKTWNGSTKAIAIILIAALIGWVVRTVWQVDRRLESFYATYQSDQMTYKNDLKSMATDRNTMKKEVAKNSLWIYNWENVDKVRERDTKQDERIKQLQALTAELKTRLREVEHLNDQLGGPKDPLWDRTEKLSTRIASLEEYIRR